MTFSPSSVGQLCSRSCRDWTFSWLNSTSKFGLVAYFFLRYVCAPRGQQVRLISARHCYYFKPGWIALDRAGWPPLRQHSSFFFPPHSFLSSDIWTAAATRGQISALFRAESRYTSARTPGEVHPASARLNINNNLPSDDAIMATPLIHVLYLTEAAYFLPLSALLSSRK